MGDARSVSLIAIHTHDIPQEFPRTGARRGGAGARRRAGTADRPARHAADHHRRRGCARLRRRGVRRTGRRPGFRLIVAIADVAHYVRPGSALDHAARTRGNSVYFPDRVVPMLPEALSNGWCSLRPHEDRGCLFVEMRVDAARPQDRPPLRPRPDAQRRAADLRAGAAARRMPATTSACRCRICMPRSAPCWRARHGARHARSRPAGAQGRAGRRRPRAAAWRRGRGSTATG